MKFEFLKSRKFLWWFISIAVLIPVLFFGILLLYVYMERDNILQNQITALNKQHKGLVLVGSAHLSPFEHFPYLSIKVDDVQVYETKADNKSVIMDVADIYIGFNVWDIVSGNYDIQTLLIEEGVFNIVLHEDGTNNLQNALATSGETGGEELMEIHLKNIELRQLDIHKLDETTNTDVQTFIYWAKGGFNTENDSISAHIDTEFELNVIENGDTTYIHHKHFEFHTDVMFDLNTGLLTIEPSGVTLENGEFELEGSVDTKNDMKVDLAVRGTKPNFDMLIAFAPNDLIPVLERYKNAGKIYFNAAIQGPTLHGKMPLIDARFGASEAFLENTDQGKRIDDMGFKGYFTNGEERNMRTMEFSMTDMTAKLESGKFLGAVVVSNFEEPEVDMQVNADFNLEFLAGFLNLTDIENATGNVSLEMRFHDIIDLDQPELALNDLDQAYFSELKVTNLSLSSALLPKPLKQLDMHLIMNGKKATLEQFDVLLGKSDVSITGYLSDLPAIVHQLDIPVVAHLEIESDVFDIAEITGYSEKDSTGINERIEDLSAGFTFKSSAKAFAASRHLPKGEFFIDSLHAQLKHYPHELHDFHVDILVDDRDLKIVDFTGHIDESDFHFNGFVHDYGFWMQDELDGDVDLDITLTSDLLRLEDIFSYQGENYVPEDYRHEEFEDLVLHVESSMHYKESALHSIDIDLDQLNAKMQVHPMRFEDFEGKFHYEDDHLTVEKFHGKVGRTVFDVNMNYYLGDDQAIKKRDNYLSLKANYVDFDQLFNINPTPSTPTKTTEKKAVATTADVKEHAEAFNLYELPFTDMQFDVNVNHFIYNSVDLQDIKANLRTTQNHYIYVDTLQMNAAGGSISMSGYFNGSDPKRIYLKPDLIVEDVNIDKLMFKFENFGQDHVVSENLHGRLSTRINGNIRVYPDLVPDLDQSEVQMYVEVLDGRLENYEPMLMLADYMGDKDLKNIRFDTLKNQLDISNGQMTIPNMTIESTLGHMELSGTQDIDYNIEYFLRIPWKTVKQAARYKLFGDKKSEDGQTGDDEIIELDPNKRVRYLNLKIHGNLDDFKIGLGKAKRRKN